MKQRFLISADILVDFTGMLKYNDTVKIKYDQFGNLYSKEDLFTGTTYTYGDSEWKDLLTNFNGDTITYDQIGNPLSYRNGFNFTWSNGRQLTSVTRGETNVSYLYDADGMRTQKTINGITTDYYYLNGVLQAQKTGDEYIIFLYDENGSAYGMIIKNGETVANYYYLFNAQGDVIGIIDQNGEQVVTYEYGAWGDVVSVTGSLAQTVGAKNPIRYRGYYYDGETGFYYLQSRYYDPYTARFINADGEIGVGTVVLGSNLFTYCENNPTNMYDPGGNWPKWVKGVLNVVSGAVQVAAGAALAAAVGWTGIGMVAAGILVANGTATIAQGVGQIVNSVTKSKTMREDNVIRTTVRSAGRAAAGKKGGKIAGGIYDATVTSANLYAGAVNLKQYVPKYMPKVIDSKIFSINNGYGFKVGKNIELLYQNPNAAGGPGGTIFSYKGSLGKFRIDWDPAHGFHCHPPGH